MVLYEKFIKVNHRESKEITVFLINYCNFCRDVVLVLAELDPENNGKNTDKVFEKIKNKFELDELKREIRDINLSENCYGCELCNVKVFKEKKQKIKKITRELDSFNQNNLTINLNKVLSENFNAPFLLKVDKERKYIYEYECRNLYQKIIFDLVQTHKDILNRPEDSKDYFNQIAEILLSTYNFIEDIQAMRNNFMEWNGSFYYRKDNTPYDLIHVDSEEGMNIFNDYIKNHEKFRNTHKVIYSEIEKLREKYKLSPRWRVWLYNVLRYDFENDRSAINAFIPDGSILYNSELILDGVINKVVRKPIITGDETLGDKKNFEIKTGQVIDLEIGKLRRKPIGEFEKQLRWYRLKEDDYSYIEIFDYDLENHFEDWREFKEYRNNRNQTAILISGHELSYFERMAINRIKSGIKKIKDRIYRVYK